MTAVGHVTRKVHSILPPSTHTKQDATCGNNINNYTVSDNSNNNSNKQISHTTSYNTSKDETNGNVGKTCLLHKCRVAGMTLADYMWCNVK